MSALAKKMMEKYGWKEGEGLGKERTGMRSFVKVVRRDPNVATGLGHAADPTQGGSLASTHAVELDAIYGQLHREKKKMKKRVRSSSSSSDSDSEMDEEEQASSVQRDGNRSSINNSARKADVKENKTGVKKSVEKPSHCQRDSSSDDDSDSSSDDEDAQTAGKRLRREAVGDVTLMTDKDLFARCGGVRLGRAGRHRFFDGKLKRIHGNP
ncbi:hypothetical protein ABL78_4330 [Leptomonas seymouri]|uniref:G-patch domain-containing protein n=1 Tax=Leptomonas seymouri TaxID=5684 RepID=A0A0N1I6K7_LEPSE|nr:hypothetical protein ABL78_4330 [Leptomonas seymouri]|eukprot:KPI86601.1 hypothetical protein ABL78_4330 [Leptomonas seymouri]